jgi:hypothetical protein
VVQAPDEAAATALYRDICAVTGFCKGEVDFDLLKQSGHTFQFVMSDGVGVTIND